MIWSNKPPTTSGWYWVKGDASDEMCPTRLHIDGSWECHPSMVLFGPPIPTPEQCHEIAKGGGA